MDIKLESALTQHYIWHVPVTTSTWSTIIDFSNKQYHFFQQNQYNANNSVK